MSSSLYIVINKQDGDRFQENLTMSKQNQSNSINLMALFL